MRRFASFFIVCMVIIPLLMGCFDANELEDFVFVAMIGIDKGVTDTWRLTFLLPSLSEGAKNGGGGEGNLASNTYTTFTIEAPTFFEGVSLANISISKDISFIHANTIVFSEDLAKSGLVGEFITPLIRNREIRRTEYVVVSKGSAKDFVEAAGSNIESTVSKQFEILMDASKNTGFFPKTTLNDMYNAIKSSYRQPIAIYGAINSGENLKDSRTQQQNDSNPSRSYYAGDLPREGGNKIELMGSVVADGDTMVGLLTGQETRIALLARGELEKGTFSIQDPEKPDLIVPVEIRLARKPQIKVETQDNKPVIDVKIKLEGDILAIQSRINYENPKLAPLLEKAVEKHIKAELDETIKKCQELRADVFNFGYAGIMKFGTIQEWEAYQWNKQFENAEVTTAIEFRIRRTGILLDSSPIISTEGEE